jgi:hypothetical protein
MKENKNNKKIKLSPWIVWGYKNPKKENWEIKNRNNKPPPPPTPPAPPNPTPPKKKKRKKKEKESHLAQSHVFD